MAGVITGRGSPARENGLKHLNKKDERYEIK